MSKAEDRGKTYALHKANEKLHVYYGNAMLSVIQFDGCDIKNAYIDGHHQAEKDLELTVKDIVHIIETYNELEFSREFATVTFNDTCQEILKRFKEKKKE